MQAALRGAFPPHSLRVRACASAGCVVGGGVALFTSAAGISSALQPQHLAPGGPLVQLSLPRRVWLLDIKQASANRCCMKKARSIFTPPPSPREDEVGAHGSPHALRADILAFDFVLSRQDSRLILQVCLRSMRVWRQRKLKCSERERAGFFWPSVAATTMMRCCVYVREYRK